MGDATASEWSDALRQQLLWPFVPISDFTLSGNFYASKAAMPFARLLPVLCAAALAVAPGTFTSLRESYVDRGRAAVEGFIRDLARRAGNISANRADEADAHAGAGYNSSGKSYVRTLLRLLHARQHPPRHECKATRLLLVKSPEISFEGLGSVLSLLTLGLAEAVYSNRTLIWGAELTPLLELSRAVWAAPNASVRGVPLDCSSAVRGGGAYACFFEPLSSCSLADATPTEVAALRDSGYSDVARLKIMDHRRSFVAYAAPPGIPQDPPPLWPNHLWYGALATYVFRVQAPLRAVFEATRASLSGGVWAADTACAHVRHGDVLSLSKVYTNRDSFDFREYFSALLLRPAAPVPALQDESPGAAPPPQWPQAVFVASDSTHTHSALRRERAEHVERQWEARSRGEAAVLPPLPPFLAVPETRGRFLTEYGSHTVAGGYGICMKSRCGLPLEAMQRYDAEIDANGPSRAPRILGVVFDAAEDLHLLSRCSRLATTAASRYGVVAVALGWAATGGASVPATVFVDAATVASGELQSGWIHWADPGLRRGQPGEQWRSFTRMFVEGLWTEDGAAKSAANAMPVAGSALPPPRLIHLRSFLPWVPPELLWAEALRWGGDDGEACSGSGAGETGEAAEPGVEGGCRVWHGECPLVSPPGTPLKLAIAAQINAGMRHLAHNHVAQAVSCWQTALGLLGLVEKQGLSNATAASISHRSGQAPDSADASGGTGSSGSGSGAVVEFSAAEASFLRGVAERNLASVAESDGWPYNRGSAEVAEMLARNVPAASDFASEWTRGGGAPAL